MARLIVLLLLLVPGFAQSSKGAPSDPQYKVKFLYTRVPMRDGVELAFSAYGPGR